MNSAVTMVVLISTTIRRIIGEPIMCSPVDSIDSAIVNLPAEGEGNYRDPTDILGTKFTADNTVHLCDTQLFMYAEELTKVKFTSRGTKLCNDVCVQYRKNMEFHGDIEIQLIQSYCSYIGSEDSNEKIGLEKTCACPYNVRCKQRAEVITYTFQSNCAGFLRVAVFESKFHRFVT
ncbi:uncharacterized protein LOC126898852 [Daktulosphaira vitifoliae]|uniref:uncharacterized protein LOC126898852 n=1 Tax=Daktulosphaira vitifoliae TaxID=58002 RepID=UPI0021A97F81|nr:uncharacterized protein LOC126898852 [Daktulosphaira vitifoliae]